MNKRAAISAMAWIVIATASDAGTYYVATTGDDYANDGLSESTPFRTINRAAELVDPGDTVLIADGTYSEAVSVHRSGRADAYIVFKSVNKWGARVEVNTGANGFWIAGNYIEVDGIELTNPSGHGFNCERSHHVRILNCHAYNCGNSGISGGYSDFYHFEGNVCHNNAQLSWYSGISIYEAESIGDASPGYHIIIRNNICYSNIQLYGGPYTDGNGIIVDDWNHTQNPGEPYPHEALVENNLCYENGGAGVKCCWSDHVTFRHNVAYRNNLDNKNTGTYRGDLYCQQSRDTRWINNIGWADPSVNRYNTGMMDKGVASGDSTTANIWAHNIVYDGTGLSTATGDGSWPTLTDNLGVNPQWLALPGTAGGPDFHLQSTSPAIDAGTAAYGYSTDDLDGGLRPIGAAPDIGCYEYVGIDTDGDGLPDAWELWHRTNLADLAYVTDYDGDRLSDAEEYMTGTSPVDPASVLVLGISNASALEVRVSAVTIPAGEPWYEGQVRYYTIQSAETLSGPWSNVPGAEDIVGDGGEISCRSSRGQGFFRLHVELRPVGDE